MNFKKSKLEVINEARNATKDSLYIHFGNLKSNLLNNSTIDNLDYIRIAIEASIDAAIRNLVENTYTDQEFEEDLTLR